MLHERLHAEDGVVPPVVAVVLLPVVQAGEEKRAVEPVGILLNPRVQRLAIHDARRVWMMPTAGFFSIRATRRTSVWPVIRLSASRTTNVTVVPSPAPQKVREIAALAVDGLAAFAIENAPEAPHLFAELDPRDLLLDPIVRLVGVAQDEEVEMLQLPGLLDRPVDDAQPLEDPADILVQMGTTMAVPASGWSFAADQSTVLTRRQESPPRLSTKKPINAVQKPVAMCAKRITKSTSRAIATPPNPVRQNRSAMNQVANPVNMNTLVENTAGGARGAFGRAGRSRRVSWVHDTCGSCHRVIKKIPARAAGEQEPQDRRAEQRPFLEALHGLARDLGDRTEIDRARHHARHRHVGSRVNGALLHGVRKIRRTPSSSRKA